VKATTHAMIDIETLGLLPGSVITQIAARKFNPEIGCIDNTESFKVNVMITDYPESAFISSHTLRWWADQPPQLFVDSLKGRCGVKNALGLLSNFLYDTESFWAKSPSFDMAHLDFWYGCYGLSTPWTYQNQFDVRTAVAMSGVTYTKAETPHDPLSDCDAQIKDVIASYRHRKDTVI
jgi:hypothetical protein